MTSNKPKLRVLIVDDEAELRRSLLSIMTSQLTEYDFEICEADSGRTAIERVRESQHDLVLMDVRMPETSGIEALEAIKRINPRTFVVIMTAHANLQDAVAAIKLGAYDYIEKPIEPTKLTNLIKKALETQELVSNLAISRPILDDDIDTEFVGSSEKMVEIFDLINRLSKVDTTVLIRGENGTGKELVAKAIHYNSPRKHGEFVAINCAAIPENLLESEFFGHEKGAFTGAHERKIGKFQLANKGTLFLDEIGELRPEMQVKLLRALQEQVFMPVGSNREVRTNARIVAATNQNLEKQIQDGGFREDLFYRLNVMPIFMPSLRERLDDLEGLAQYFLRKYNKGSSIESFSPEALSAMKQYSWPGNIRELEGAIERALIIEQNDHISLESLPEAVRRPNGDRVNIDFPDGYSGPLDFDRFKEETEKEFIVKALKTNRGKINKTVADANIPKNTLLRKIKKYNIDVKSYY